MLKSYLISYVKRSITTNAANEISKTLAIDSEAAWNDVEEVLSDIAWIKNGKPAKIEGITNPLIHALKMAINATDSAADDILTNVIATSILQRHVDVLSRQKHTEGWDKQTLMNEYLLETPSRFADAKEGNIRFLVDSQSSDALYAESISIQCNHLINDFVKLADIPESKFTLPYDASSLLNMINLGSAEKTEGARINISRYRKTYRFTVYANSVSEIYTRNVARDRFFSAFDEYNASQASIVDLYQKGQSNFYNVIDNSAAFMNALSELKVTNDDNGFNHRAFDNLAYALLKSNISMKQLNGLSMSAVLRMDASLKSQFSQVRHHSTNTQEIVNEFIEDSKTVTELSEQEKMMDSAIRHGDKVDEASTHHQNNLESYFDGDNFKEEIAEQAKEKAKKITKKTNNSSDKYGKKKKDPPVPPVVQRYVKKEKEKEEEKIVLTFGDVD